MSSVEDLQLSIKKLQLPDPPLHLTQDATE